MERHDAYYRQYVQILREELRPATGCTEPIAIAYGAAKARQVLGQEPERMEIRCSGNIIKNVKGVVVPNSGGMIGIEAAAALAVLGYTQQDIAVAMKGVDVENLPLEEIVRQSLKKMVK